MLEPGMAEDGLQVPSRRNFMRGTAQETAQFVA
jgi:hypothetical protein